MSSIDVVNWTVNWDRAVFINASINDDLVGNLTPNILSLRNSSEPITVAIDSPGGSLASLDTLLGLLTGPTQSISNSLIITVSTNKAYSAAANLLAFGNYAVALPHSNILFHDVRYSEIEDVTPSKALDVAKSLQDTNDHYALRLANHIIRRLVWVFLDQKKEFLAATQKFPKTFEKYKLSLGSFSSPQLNVHFVDIASFATVLFSKLSRNNDQLVNGVMDRLSKWIILTDLAKSFPTYREKGSRKAGLLDGLQALTKELSKNLGRKNIGFAKNESEIKLLLALLGAELSDADQSLVQCLDEATRNFFLIQSMNDERHKKSALRIMLRHNSMFLGRSISNLEKAEQDKIISSAMPYAQIFWLFCVSLCRELFEGEHILSPKEAQLLGLVDEVAGGGLIESRREFNLAQSS